MTDENLRPRADDEDLSAERRALLRGASALVAGAAIGYTFPGTARAQQSPATPAPPFPGFTRHRIETSGGVGINAVIGGNGPPLLLLHGAPLTYFTWRDVAPGLADEFTVVATDLRGYGDSSQPQGLPDHSNYSKRAMALDQIEVMRHFGFERFAVVGQDRGGRVAHRMALDHPDALTRAVFIDIVPTYYLYTNVTLAFVQAYFHWFSFLQAPPTPENALLAQREAQASRGQLTTAQAEYHRTNGTPAGVHAMCEDYRAAASIDLVHDAADLDERIRCPLHVLWAEGGAMERLYDVLAIWRERGTNVTGKGMPGGHNMQEGAPAEVLAELQAYLR
jgi:haloacetate dehalogenase